MKKIEQMAINEEVKKAWLYAGEELENNHTTATIERLRTCNACVIETNNYYFLQSYNTIVAFIEKSTDTIYDILRYVYGYTATSAQHIAKFRHDYGAGKWGCEHELRYYEL